MAQTTAALLDREEAKLALSAFLQDFLKTSKLKVTWLANECGIFRVNMSKIVHGHVLPDPPACHAIAAVCGVEPEYILQLAGHLAISEEKETIEIADPELALQFRQIGKLDPEDIAFFKDFLSREIKARKARKQSNQHEAVRPNFARPVTSREGGSVDA